MLVETLTKTSSMIGSFEIQWLRHRSNVYQRLALGYARLNAE